MADDELAVLSREVGDTAPSRWTLEQYNVSPPQLVKRQP